MVSFDSAFEQAFLQGFFICSCDFGDKDLNNSFTTPVVFLGVEAKTFLTQFNAFEFNCFVLKDIYFNWFVKLGFFPAFSLSFSIFSSFFSQLVNCQLETCSTFSFSYFTISCYHSFFHHLSFVCTFIFFLH